MADAERKRQLQQEFFQKFRQIVESEDYKNVPDNIEGVENYMFEHLGEEFKVLAKEHPVLLLHFFTEYSKWKYNESQKRHQ